MRRITILIGVVLMMAIVGIVLGATSTHDADSEFTGTANRLTDEDSGATTSYKLSYEELPADEHTVGLWHMNNEKLHNDLFVLYLLTKDMA